MMLVKVLQILFVLFRTFDASLIKSVNDFPKTEKLNYEALHQNWVHHNVRLETIPLNGSSYSSLPGYPGYAGTYILKINLFPRFQNVSNEYHTCAIITCC